MWNRSAELVIADFSRIPEEERNLIHLIFLNPDYRCRLEDWEAIARYSTAFMRANFDRYKENPLFMRRFERLLQESEDFDRFWELQVQMEMFRQIREQQESGIAYGRQEGQKAKDFILKNALGEPVTLYDELSKGPVVLTFYRGGWCPFCNTQLKAYQKLLPDIEALGGQLIAVRAIGKALHLSVDELKHLFDLANADTASAGRSRS